MLFYPPKMISWEYLAGFTDGEGSISYGNHGNQVQLTWSQSNVNIVALDAIVEFLEAHKISYSWDSRVNNTGCEYSRVSIGSQSAVRKCLEEMVAHLTLKQDRAIEALKFLNSKDRAASRRKSHCKHGHHRTKETIYIHPTTGKMSCKVCKSKSRMRGAK